MPGSMMGLSSCKCILSFLTAIFLAGLLAAGCSEGERYSGVFEANINPEVEITNGPLEGDSTCYRVHFYWLGYDPDGTIDHYEIALVDGDPTGFDPEDTLGSDKWTWTCSGDTLISAIADVFDTVVTIQSNQYALYDKVHTFFIRAVDDRGGLSETAYRSFNAYTLAPHVVITEPVNVNPDGGTQTLSPVIRFKWYGKDPIDFPWNYQNVDSTRYLWTKFFSSTIADLNRNPQDYDHLWSKWYSVDAIGDSGISTVLGDDEVVAPGRSYIFAVQAKDDAGAVTSVFDARTNVRTFFVRAPTGPRLDIFEPFLGTFSFIGEDLSGARTQVPPGFKLFFTWKGDASSYGAIVSTFRFGWDISDVTDPSEWETMPSPYVTSSGSKAFNSGIHSLFVEATDNLGVSTLGVIEIEVIPIVMQRSLLWMDDYPSANFTQDLYAYPTEQEHDMFWTEICLRVPDFNPERDIYDVNSVGCASPPIDLVFKYKNIVWTYSAAIDPESGAAWTRMIRYGQTDIMNYLPHYMFFGGHLWTSGQGERTGGLAAVLSTGFRRYPCFLQCDMYNREPGGCPTLDGLKSMAYEDYCVTIIDKVHAVIKNWIPYERSPEMDAMIYAVREKNDHYSLSIHGFPKKLELWEACTRPGMFFDPMIRGFHYVEVYDPQYWMEYNRQASSQPCFHPIYRMRAKVFRSVLENQPIAFWTTKYADVVSDAEGCVAAPSVHFGIPLWFFNRAQVDSIADAIFEVWQIK